MNKMHLFDTPGVIPRDFDQTCRLCGMKMAEIGRHDVVVCDPDQFTQEVARCNEAVKCTSIFRCDQCGGIQRTRDMAFNIHDSNICKPCFQHNKVFSLLQQTVDALEEAHAIEVANNHYGDDSCSYCDLISRVKEVCDKG